MNIIEEIYQDTESFRDQIATVDKKGKRIWVYPKKPKGKFTNARTVVSWALLALLFGMPFIRVNGSPLMLFNVLEGRFIIFGLVFSPQDLHLFALAMVTLMVFIVLFTVVFGRLFCGWVCPQTIFMEHVYRKIEYWIEGDANQQKKLNASPWTSDKILKKGIKHILFFAIAVVIANIFLSYIIGSDAVLQIISEPVSQNLGGFAAMLIFSGLFYGVFSYMREQVCTTICPYGRLQGVLLVKDSIVVHYDFVRGEPRGKIGKAAAASSGPAVPLTVLQANPIATKAQGDCIDCKLCVQVCPTGIDIRNGTQLECVNCTACMDACDDVMTKVNRPTGLIRYDSFNGVQQGKRNIFSVRVLAYTGVLVALIALQAFLFANRSDVETLVLRTPGQTYEKLEDGSYRNLYNWEVINKTPNDIGRIEFKIKGLESGKIQVIGQSNGIVSPKEGMVKGVLMIDLPAAAVTKTKTELVIEVRSDGKLIDEAKTNFLGPIR